MADEVMIIEGFFANGEKEERTMGASILNGFVDDLTDTKAWMNGAKAAVGGAVGRVTFPLIFKGLDKVIPSVTAKMPAGGLIRGAVQAVGGVLIGVLAERYVGETAAAGFIGGASGGVIGGLANKVLPANMRLELGDVGDNALSPEERAFLNGTMNEVAVESVPLLNEVGVETLNPLADVEAENAVLFQ